MRALIMLTVPAAFLAGCSSEPSVSASNASVSDVQNKIAESGNEINLRPGRWEGTMSMKSSMGGGAADQNTPMKICIKAEQLKPGANPFQAQLQAGCKYDKFEMSGGKVNSEMTCDMQGMKMKTKSTGEFTADSYKVQGTGEMEGGPAGMAGMKSETSIDLRRTGDCKGDETGA